MLPKPGPVLGRPHADPTLPKVSALDHLLFNQNLSFVAYCIARCIAYFGGLFTDTPCHASILIWCAGTPYFPIFHIAF